MDYGRKITAHWPLINRIAQRRFGDTALAEEAALYVLDRLHEDNCGRLRSYQGRSKFSTFLASVSIRLLEDFSRHRFGRLRPPSWIDSLGGIWLTLFELLCLQRLKVTDAVQTLLSRRAALREKEIEQAAWTILERVTDCGRHQGLEVEFDETGPTGQGPVKEDNSPEQRLMDEQQQIFTELLFSAPDRAVMDRDFIRRLREKLNLKAEEQLLLKLCFQEELSVTRAGGMLGLNANQAHGKLRRLLARIRRGFEDAGIADELKSMLYR